MPSTKSANHTTATRTNSLPPVSNSSTNFDQLFTIIFTVAVTFGVLLLLIILFIVIYWRRRRRMQDANLENDETFEECRTHGLAYSLRRTYSEGPLYAVTNLNSVCNATPTQNDGDTKIIYEHYLTPVDGVVIPQTSHCAIDESGYLQPVSNLISQGKVSQKDDQTNRPLYDEVTPQFLTNDK